MISEGSHGFVARHGSKGEEYTAALMVLRRGSDQVLKDEYCDRQNSYFDIYSRLVAFAKSRILSRSPLAVFLPQLER
jgi:hypothetical protein